MTNYLLIILKIIFTGTSQNDIYQKLAISKNVDNVVIKQLLPEMWVAKDRMFITFDSTTALAGYLYNMNQSTAISDIEIYTVYKSTFTYLPPRVDIQIR